MRVSAGQRDATGCSFGNSVDGAATLVQKLILKAAKPDATVSQEVLYYEHDPGAPGRWRAPISGMQGSAGPFGYMQKRLVQRTGRMTHGGFGTIRMHITCPLRSLP